MRTQENDSIGEKRNKLCNLWLSQNHRNKLIFAKSLCFAVAVMFIALTFVYVQTINEVKASMNDTISLLKEERFDQIYLYAMELRTMASNQAGDVAMNIERDIRSNINLDKLKEDLDGNVRNEELHMIFRKNISTAYLNDVNNQRNSVFITSMDGIIEDLNYHRASDSSDAMFRDWEYEIEHAYNSYLEQDAVSKLTNHSKEIIMTEHINRITVEDPNYNYHSFIKSPTYNAIKSIYVSEGLDGLKNYQFLTPAYILDTEDIFGQQSIVDGYKQKTHTFIVVQEFNLYDQIKTHYPKLMDNSYLDSVELHYSNVLNILYIIGILYGVILVVLLSVISDKYNKYFDKYDLGNIPPRNKNNRNVE